MKPIALRSLDALPEAASALLKATQGAAVYAFHGPMGAGKTTLIKAICGQLGVSDAVSSPTYALVNEYRDRLGQPVYHFDFYRIDDVNEAYDMGVEEYFESGHLCFIEWPERIADVLPHEAVHVYMAVDEEGQERHLHWEQGHESLPYTRQ